MPSQSVSSSSRPPSISTFSSVPQPTTPFSTASHDPLGYTSTSRSRRPQAPPAGVSLGLEEEVSFGSDEDLMGDVGEIVYTAPPPSKRDREHSGGTIMSFGSRSAGKKLAKSSLVLPQGLEVGLEQNGSSASSLETRLSGAGGGESKGRKSGGGGGGLMGALKGFGRKKDAKGSHSNASSDSLAKSVISSSTTSPKPSLRRSGPSLTRLAPIDQSPFNPSPPPSRLARSSISTTNTHTTSSTTTSSSLGNGQTRSSVSSRDFAAAGNPLTATLIPDFPTTPQALASITLLSAHVLKRTPLSSTGGLEKSHSIRSTLGLASLRAPHSPSSSSSSSAWTPHVLVLTSFKLSAPTPPSSPYPESRRPSTATEAGAGESTIAHLHVFRTGGRGYQLPGDGNRVELERRLLEGTSTAGMWEGEGKRGVLRVGFDEGEEWLCDFGDATTLQDWIRQIKDLVVIVRAEQMGLGSVIRQSLATDPSRDLSLQLSMHTANLLLSPPSLDADADGDDSPPPLPDDLSRRGSALSDSAAPLLSLAARRGSGNTHLHPFPAAGLAEGDEAAKPESPGLLDAFPDVPAGRPQPPVLGNSGSGGDLQRTRSFDSLRPISPSSPPQVVRAGADGAGALLRRSRSTGIKPSQKRQSWASLSSQATGSSGGSSARTRRFGPPSLPPPSAALPLPPQPSKATEEHARLPPAKEETPPTRSAPVLGSELPPPLPTLAPQAETPRPSTPRQLPPVLSPPPRTASFMFKPIPLAPEMEMHIPAPAPAPARADSASGRSTPQFYTPTEEPSAGSVMGGWRSGASDADSASIMSSRLGSEAGSSVTGGGGRRRRFKKMTPAVDIMAEFAASKDSLPREEEVEIVEDRPRVIRFAA